MPSKNRRYLRRDPNKPGSYTYVPRQSQAKHADTVKKVCPTMRAIEEKRRLKQESALTTSAVPEVVGEQT